MLDPKTKLPTSPDILSERMERLKSDFPDLFTAEGSLDRDALEGLLSDVPLHREQYRFEWAGKHASKRHAFTPSTARLQYDESRSVHPEEAKGNMIIEWDNLEVLKLLTSAYRGQVKCIYIDPPYNTGKDFVYSDNYTDGREAYWNKTGQVEDGVRVDTNSESAGRYHSDWLSMMHSRLLLARWLLKDDWVIFVSIDDHEVHNLRKLMDEVFGEENFVAQIIWQKKTWASDAVWIATITEYALIFTRNIEFSSLIFSKNLDSYDITRYSLSDEFLSKRGNYYIDNLDRWWLQYSDSLNFWIKCPDWTITFPNWRNQFTQEWWIWKWSERKVNWALQNGFIEFRKSKTKESWWSVCYKNYLFVDNEWENIIRSAPHKNLINNVLNAHASNDLKDIFEQSIFDYSKPVAYLKKIISLIQFNSDDIILDFFAWSGTTGQAVIELNQEDGGNRRYILVQLPEFTDEKSEACKAWYKKISDITIERNKRVIQWYGDTPKPIEWVGFRVYTLARSAFPRVDFAPDPEKTEEENLKALDDYIARKEAVFSLVDDNPGIIDEVILKNGFRLDYTLSRLADITTNTVYLVTDTTWLSAYLCLDRPLSSETVAYFQSHTDKRFICLEQWLDTTAKWNLRNALGDLFVAY